MMMKACRISFIVVFFLFKSFLLQASSLDLITQTLRGRVVDTDTKAAIAYANILIIASHPPLGAVTDEDGYFAIRNVPLGRVSVKVSYLGYEEMVLPNIQVISGRETVLNIEIREAFRELKEVVVSARQHKSEVGNEMAMLSSRNVSVEESNRFAGAFSDPARLVSSFAGVGADGLGNNDIIVRGNNSRFIQWRLEGIEIPNPNHFSAEGLTGGPINALNSQMLANSDFFTGAFAPQYGNVLSGIFDMKLRNGNFNKREYTFTASVLGTDFTLEGPFKMGGKSSYLFNYRYSTLGLLDQMNLVDFNGIPKYQDLSFKILMPTAKLGTFTLFGLGGDSNFNLEFEDKNNPSENVVVEQLRQDSRLGIVGLKQFLPLSSRTYINTAISVSNNGATLRAFRSFGQTPDLKLSHDMDFNNNTYRVNSVYNYRYNSRNLFQAGVVLSRMDFSLNSKYFDRINEIYIENQDNTGKADQVQGFMSWKWRITEQLSMVNGLHTQKTSMNDELTLEPRLAMRYDVSPRQAFTAGFGLHSHMTSISNYYARIADEAGQLYSPNTNMGLLMARHYVLGFENRLSQNLFVKIEAYYQDLYNIPVEAHTSYSLINQVDIFTDRVLENKGKARNTGIEFTLERYLANQYYFLITASVFDSKYVAGDGKWRNTRFNGNYIGNFLFGREFNVGPENKNVFGLNSKISLLGAQRQLYVKHHESVLQGIAVYDEPNAFIFKGDDVFSMNMAVNYRINKPRVSHEFKIDIQNLTNNQSFIMDYYDDANQEVEKLKQLPILPVLSYTLNF
jgi:hypothetical protein